MLLESSLVSQFQHENETWKRMLAFLREENINIKNRLSEIVKGMRIGDEEMLERIEYFQNCFVTEDDRIRQLVKLVEQQDKLLVKDAYEDGSLLRSVKANQAKLRKELEKTEREINKLKFEFNNYLSEVL